MIRLEDLKSGARIMGMLPQGAVTVVDVPWWYRKDLWRTLLKRAIEPEVCARETRWVESLAIQAMLDIERRHRCEPRDVSRENYGWDIESRAPVIGRLHCIEVKGRMQGAHTVTITKNEILAGLNKPVAFILALVEVDREATACHYLRSPLQREPDFGVASVHDDLAECWTRAEEPA